MQLAGKVAIVGGASRGIGKDMALAFAAEGAKVVVVARSEVEPDPRLPGTIHQTVDEIKTAGGEAIAVKADISDEAQVETMAKSALDAYGRIDILVNNAAVLVPRGILDLPTRHIDLHNRVNIKGPILCIRAVLPAMLQQQQGWVINVSSHAAVFPGPGPYTDVAPTRAFMYAATKAALERLTQGLAMEYQDQGISFNVLSPVGRIRTPGNVFGMTKPGETPEPFEEAIAMGKSAVFICSQNPRTFTGNILFDAEVVRRYDL
ncbi:MAG TPA: SDR family NAD(P)-dependent oxidoreductase [Candidatus Saccharimonadia bacterium]|jgi:citronellol/citronellal dehydrogenase|nr:SDR family NAD(P)-dependent oxidoreductase [Candidatus Saccharimonadia bacterium]